jgi:hypothetical protein
MTTITTAFIWILLLCAPIAVALTWRIALPVGSTAAMLPPRSIFVLALITLSLLLLICSYFWPMVLGPEYNRERYGLIFSNIGLMLLGSVVSAFAPKPMKFYLLFSSIILAVVWAYVWVVNSTV